jgi:uncharacterized protein YjbI with pentapeptide repeats
MTKRTSRVAWGLAVALTIVVLGGTTVLGGWLRSCWVVRHRGLGADLHSAFLIHAPLRGVKLHGTNLLKANLAGADLSRAYLVHVKLRSANLSGADLSRTIIVHVDLRSARMAEARLYQAQVSGDLRGANLSGADLRSSMVDAMLQGADFTGADLQDARVVAQREGGRSGSFDLTAARLRGANLTNLKFGLPSNWDVFHPSTTLQEADLRGTVLIGVDLSNVILTGAIYDRHTRWPLGFDPQRHGAVRIDRVEGETQ